MLGVAEEVVSAARGVMRFLGWSLPEPMVEVVARATTSLEMGREVSLLSSIVAACLLDWSGCEAAILFARGSHERNKAAKDKADKRCTCRSKKEIDRQTSKASGKE